MAVSDGRDKINRSRDGSDSHAAEAAESAYKNKMNPLAQDPTSTRHRTSLLKAIKGPASAYVLPTATSSAPEKQQDFLCYGQLKLGGRWGCGRRFDRLHDFARHLKTPTGRKCIQPLYDDERQMRARKTGSPTSPQSDDSDASSFFSFAVSPEISTAAHFPGHGVFLQSQLQLFPCDFSCAAFYGDYESGGSAQLQAEMNVDNICASMSPVDTEPIMMGATVPGISYMAWWHSYLGSISSFNRFGEFASHNL
ncbi:hypothetical protein E4U53_000613 [Claviceps sorghi]|nr:hypothetical protein E4U53_000613 [Claviceps sorghi]